ncbi:MAG: RNA-directed DNA polymerase [Microcoleus sp.]
MNKDFWLEQIKKREVFERAYVYAISYQINEDAYCNFIEITYYRQKKEELFKEIEISLENPSLYEPETAFSFYLPKSDMFFRRMIYTPFKDLVIKFIFVSVLAELLDVTLVHNCFSHRFDRKLEKHHKSNGYLYKPYYKKAFPEFIAWQFAQVENSTCMLKTDISSFYDSISHEYLLSAISRKLNISNESHFMILFSKTLKFTTCYYSIVDGKLCETYNSQGIPIGNSAEGFIANMFLNEVDEALFNLGINFGRYVDDFRFFTKDKTESLKALIILQEFLLKRGLNLNTSKTKIIEAQEKIIEFIKHSNKSGVYGMPCEEESYTENKQEEKLDKTQIIKEIDSQKTSEEYQQLYFSKYPKKVIKIQDFDEDRAEQFCIFLRNIKFNAKLENQIFSQHMEWLYILSKKYPKYWKSYSWLFVKFIALDYSNDIQNISFKYLLKIFDDQDVNIFIKTRIIHHLVKPRKGALTYIERIGKNTKLRDRIIEYITKLMKISCIVSHCN